jgi:hypothetical protein
MPVPGFIGMTPLDRYRYGNQGRLPLRWSASSQEYAVSRLGTSIQVTPSAHAPAIDALAAQAMAVGKSGPEGWHWKQWLFTDEANVLLCLGG